MKYTARIFWKKKETETFTDNKYSRGHTWVFDGGVELPASASPQVVPLPMSIESAVDPEEAFVAAISSCHMLFFLSIAASSNYIIETYDDQAEGIMSKNEHGQMIMGDIILKPKIVFSGTTIPTAEQIAELHNSAHHKCYLANSIKSTIKIIQS
ncbi:MAG: OsmC family protein [Chitinophagaceae bacterium]